MQPCAGEDSTGDLFSVCSLLSWVSPGTAALQLRANFSLYTGDMETARAEAITHCHIVSDKPPVQARRDSWTMLPMSVMDTIRWGPETPWIPGAVCGHRGASSSIIT